MKPDAQTPLLNNYQHHFPLEPRPFERIGRELGLTESQVLETLEELTACGLVSRVGGVLEPNILTRSCLAAMCVEPERLEEVAALVSAFPQVNHNYEREHQWNLWFVVHGADEAELEAALCRMESITGLEVLRLPMERAFHLDLGFSLV